MELRRRQGALDYPTAFLPPPPQGPIGALSPAAKWFAGKRPFVPLATFQKEDVKPELLPTGAKPLRVALSPGSS